VARGHVSLGMTRHSHTVTALAAVAAATMLVAGCGSAPRPAPARLIRGVAAHEPVVSAAPYGAADTRFGLQILAAECRQNPAANVVLSPASLASGLGMAYLGARGRTARAMAGALHLPATGTALQAGLAARSASLRGLDGPGVTVTDTDQVWADPSLPPRRSYLNAVATGYGGQGVRQVPLLSHPDQSAQTINAAIAAATDGHIPDLLKPGSLQGMGWVLTDALYLSARWDTPFERAMTYSGSFTTAAGKAAQAHFLSGGAFAAARADGWTAVSLPYRGGKLSMVALLPPPAQAGCPSLPYSALASMSAGLATSTPNMDVALPKISLSSSLDMIPPLRQLGLGTAFGPAADFTGLSPAAGSIGTVVHAATLQVGEKGTVASAATAVGMLPTSAHVTGGTVTFNRPYLLLVRDTATGEPLFLARVADPATS
jgi:serpin B